MNFVFAEEIAEEWKEHSAGATFIIGIDEFFFNDRDGAFFEDNP